MTSEQPTPPMPAGSHAGARHPERIGPYRILKVLGEGGMGMVYEAEQTSPVQRRVAVKVLRPGFESSEIVARFEAERQALAVMLHESIAKPDHPFIATTHNELGIAARQAGRFDAAEKHLQVALEMRRKSLEPNSYYIALTLGAQADLARDRKRYVQAEELYRRAMAQWEASGRDEAVSTTITHGYVEMLRRLGRNQEAAALEARAR